MELLFVWKRRFFPIFGRDARLIRIRTRLRTIGADWCVWVLGMVYVELEQIVKWDGRTRIN